MLNWCLVLWILLPFLLCVGSSGSDRWKRATKAHLSVLPLSVLVRQDCQKGKALFLKEFQNFGIWSFEKSVEEMMLRTKVFTFRDLDSLSGFPSWWRRKGTWGEGDLQGMTRKRK